MLYLRFIYYINRIWLLQFQEDSQCPNAISKTIHNKIGMGSKQFSNSPINK